MIRTFTRIRFAKITYCICIATKGKDFTIEFKTMQNILCIQVKMKSHQSQRDNRPTIILKKLGGHRLLALARLMNHERIVERKLI